MNNTITETEVIEEKKINKYAGRYTGRYTEKAKLRYIENKEKYLNYRKDRYELKADSIKEKARVLYKKGKAYNAEIEALKQRITELENSTIDSK
jgi:hypothetical protein